MEIAEPDRRVLRLLLADSSLSNQELAERAGLSPSACWRRVKALTDAGVLTGQAARADLGRLGLGFQAILHVRLTRHDEANARNFVRAVLARPEITDCYATTGEADYHLRVVCRDVAAYNELLENFLFPLPGLESVRTNLVLREIKSAAPPPV